MKYLIIAILFILSLGYIGYYLYMFDKRDGIDKSISVQVTSDTSKGDGIDKSIPAQVVSDTSKRDKGKNRKSPKHLSRKFWKNVTPEQLKEKLKNIEDINEVHLKKKRSMLHLLMKFGQYPEMVDLLISAGVDYNLIDENGNKALHYAFRRTEQAYEFTKEFLKYDKNIDAPNGRSDASPLQSATFNRSDIKVIRLLLEKGANPNFQNRKGRSPLISASIPKRKTGVPFIDPVVIQLFLDYKADITIKDKNGKTALDYMKENEEFKKTELFKKLSTQFP